MPVRALNVTFTGEHGWELYADPDQAAGLWTALVEAGGPHGLVPCGYRAIESLRLEMGYRVWSTDLTPETTPYEAGLGFCVKLAKEGGFVGRDALEAAREAGLTRRMSLLVLDDPRAVVLGAEPVSVDGRVVGPGHVGRVRIHVREVPRVRLPADRPRDGRDHGHDQPLRPRRARHRHRPPHPARSVIGSRQARPPGAG